MTQLWNLSEAAGASARAIRLAAGATLAEVAKAAKGYGLPWTSGRVGDFESGRVAPSLPTLIAIAAALSEVVQDGEVTLAHLFAVDGRIRINDLLTVDAERMRELLRGAPLDSKIESLTDRDAFQRLITATPDGQPVRWTNDSLPEHLRSPGPAGQILKDFAEGDERLAQALLTDPLTAAAAMTKVWGKTFVQKRDELAGPGANAQTKGIVTRKLKAQLRAVIDGDDQ